MANKKIGLLFYSLDTNRYQDGRIKRLKKKHGCDGLAVYDYILAEIYREKGCYMEWHEDSLIDTSDYFNLEESKVTDIVNYCAEVGLFNKEIIQKKSIITSLSIQTRYLEICHRMKRTGAFIPTFIKIPSEESPQTSEESPQTSEESQQLPKIKEEVPKFEHSNKGNKGNKGKVVNKPPEFPEHWFIKTYNSNYEDYKAVWNGQSTTPEHFKNWKDFISFVYSENHESLFVAKMANPHEFAEITEEKSFYSGQWREVIEAILATGLETKHELKYRIKQFIDIVNTKKIENERKSTFKNYQPGTPSKHTAGADALLEKGKQFYDSTVRKQGDTP